MIAARSSICQRCHCRVRAVRDRDDDRPLGAEAQAIVRHAVIADLKADADELAKLFAELHERERERLLVLLFGPEASLWLQRLIVVRSGLVRSERTFFYMNTTISRGCVPHKATRYGRCGCVRLGNDPVMIYAFFWAPMRRKMTALARIANSPVTD
jgi:hypothetical protein